MKRLHHIGNKIHFVSLGCARNLVDTEVMLGILLKSGYEVTEQVEKADYLVVNTCGFLASASKESCDTIESLFEEKKKGAKVIVAGCMVQKHKEELKAAISRHPLFFGIGGYGKNFRSCPFRYSRRGRDVCAQLSRMGRSSAPALYAKELRLSQNCRRVRQTMRFLHHPEDQRPLAQQAARAKF